MSQPCTRNCSLSQPGEVDETLGEFWAGSPWEIFQKHNLSCYERNRTYLNVGGTGFLDISYLTGADTDGDSRAVIAADFNGDGRLDLALRQAGGGPFQLYENEFPSQHHLQISLRGTQSNRLGIGARMTAHVGDRRLVREHYPINTFRSHAPLVSHFGLGDIDRIDRLVVRWPSGIEQTFTDVSADQHVLIEEGNPRIERISRGEVIAP